MDETNRYQTPFITLLDAVVDGIVLINEQGIIERVNPAAEALFGFSADELMTHNVKMLMPNPMRDEHDHYLRNYLKTNTRKIIGIGREMNILKEKELSRSERKME
jgi:two-component system sensor kinase FixL